MTSVSSTTTNSLPTFAEYVNLLNTDGISQSTPQYRSEHDPCAICMEESVKDDEDTSMSGTTDDLELAFHYLPCHHGFHRGCIAPWLAAQGTCPMCRRVICHPEGFEAAEADDDDGVNGIFDASADYDDNDVDDDVVDDADEAAVLRELRDELTGALQALGALQLQEELRVRDEEGLDEEVRTLLAQVPERCLRLSRALWRVWDSLRRAAWDELMGQEGGERERFFARYRGVGPQATHSEATMLAMLAGSCCSSTGWAIRRVLLQRMGAVELRPAANELDCLAEEFETLAMFVEDGTGRPGGLEADLDQRTRIMLRMGVEVVSRPGCIFEDARNAVFHDCHDCEFRRCVSSVFVNCLNSWFEGCEDGQYRNCLPSTFTD